MAAASGGVVRYGPPNPFTPPPTGYQPPDQSAPGFPVVTQDQKNQTGAPAGYEWDPVQQRYVPKVGSATNAENIQKKLLGAFDATMSGGAAGGTVGGAPAGSASNLPPVSYPSGGGGGGGGYGGGPYPQIAQVDTRAAEDAAFNRAKDKVGQTSQGALAGLRSSLGGRGLLGSGAESRGTTNVVNEGQAQLGDVARQNAITSAQAAQGNAIANFQGQVGMRGQDIGANTTMRGQDIGERETQYQGGITQRGQDIQATSEANRNALLQTQLQFQRQQAALQALQGLQGSLAGSLSY